MAHKQLMLTVPIRTIFDTETRKGTLHVAYPGMTVRDGEGNKLGDICPTVEGGLEITTGSELEDVWFLSPRDVWEAVMAALGA